MMQFWIGDSQEYLAVEYAKSNRSTCRECKQKIGKDELRIGLLTDSDQMPLSLWHHLDCFHFKPRHKALQHQEMVQMVYGIDDLESQDCDKVLAYLEQELKNFLQNKHAKKARSKKGEKSKKDDSDYEDDDDYEVKKQKRTKKTKNDDKQKQQKGKKVTKSKTKKQQTKKFLSSEQEKLYQEYFEKYAAMSEKNNQPKTGTKDALASMCADGKLFGRIPNCPKCAGGKLRFDRQNGTYKCPGYMEDTEFKHCRATFNFQEIQRFDWTQ